MLNLPTSLSANDPAHIDAHEEIHKRFNRVYSVLDWGAVGDGSTDCLAAFRNAYIDVSAIGGGDVLVPMGVYKLTNLVAPKSNVNIIGEGIGRSILKLYGGAAIKHTGASDNVLENCTFRDLEVDASEQTIEGAKGFFITYGKNLFYERIYLHDTWATGFGNDFMVDSVYSFCIAENCGRGGTIESYGYSGFGIGTGAYQVETVTLSNCIARGNKRYGAFFEVQGGEPGVDAYYSRGCKIIGGYFEGNQWGVGDSGVEGMVVSGAHINDNIAEGLIVGGPSTGNYAGINGVVTGCEIARNGAAGISPAEPTGYAIYGNNLHDNGV